MPVVLDLHDDAASERAAQVLSDGGLLVAPLDGVYGLVADAFASEATARLRRVRGAPPDAPLTLLVRSHKQLPGVTSSVPDSAERLVAGFWPGPLTVVLPAAQTMAVDLGATRGTVAVRMPLDEHVRELVTAVGPLACSSAARVGEAAALTVDEAVTTFADHVDAYLDGGALDGQRSTVVDCSRGGAEVLRRGAISADEVIDVARGLVGWGGAPGGAGDPAGEHDDGAPPGS